MTRRLLGLLVAVVLLAASCSPGGGDNANGGLGGTDWTVTSIAGTATIPDARPTMRFAVEGQVAGSDGCNQYSGPFQTDGGDIAVGRLSSTLIGCEPLLSAQAQAFTEALTGAATWRLIQAGGLELRGHGDILAEPLVQAPAPSGDVVSDLAGTAWVLEKLGGATLVDINPTITFGGDGTVSGSAGCNTFSGTYTLDGAALSFGRLATTKMACADPTMFVESAFLAALAGVMGWSLDGDGRLVLDGARPLTLRPGRASGCLPDVRHATGAPPGAGRHPDAGGRTRRAARRRSWRGPALGAPTSSGPARSVVLAQVHARAIALPAHGRPAVGFAC